MTPRERAAIQPRIIACKQCKNALGGMEGGPSHADMCDTCWTSLTPIQQARVAAYGSVNAVTPASYNLRKSLTEYGKEKAAQMKDGKGKKGSKVETETEADE